MQKEIVQKFHSIRVEYTCDKCKNKSPKGLRLDLADKDRKWLCDKCYFKHV